jgi:glutamine amidotransferase-like uncharacterized protein
LVPVRWRDQVRLMYFQDGGYMLPNRRATGIEVLARYSNGSIAAMVADANAGKVGLCGPHPEAPQAWYADERLRYPGSTQDLGDDLIATLMKPR